MGATKQITKPKHITYEVKNSNDGTGFKVVAKLGISTIGEIYAEEIDSEQTLFITSTYVSEAHRGKGIATQLNKVLVETGKDRGYMIMFCSANINNKAIDKVLLRTGWHLITVTRHVLYYYQNLTQR